MIGGIRAVHMPDDNRHSLPYWIVEPAWGRGYATELMKTFINHLILHHDITQIRARYYDGNTTSNKILTNLRFIFSAKGTDLSPSQNRVTHWNRLILSCKNHLVLGNTKSMHKIHICYVVIMRYICRVLLYVVVIDF